MNTIKAIRKRLGVTQTELAGALGCTQSNVGHYEKGQTMPPEVAGRFIVFAQGKGQALTFNEIYEHVGAQALANAAQAAAETVAGGAGV